MGVIFGVMTITIGLVMIGLAIELKPEVFFPVAGGFFGIWLIAVGIMSLRGAYRGDL